ncbi:MAG: phosphoglucosamine mutase [Candidatus Diapherotrites archaeon]|nr:phosphoglucosamine mutase [Candidatus Diapherotrites archaeon]
MKLFGTDGIRGKANEEPMTAQTVVLIGKAIARNLKKNSVKNDLKILIGKDTRLSNYMLEMSLASGILSEGIQVLLVGPVPTPAVAHLTKSFACARGIMLTASHNHAFDNGIKVFDSQGFKITEKEEKEIESLVFSDEIKNPSVKNEFIGRAKRIDDAAGRYIEFCKSTIKNHSLKGLKIVVDCANGASYKIAPTIFEELGAKVIVSGNNPNGVNINLDCGALNLDKLKEKVLEEKADCGFAFDGDADRVMFVDEKGIETDGDFILAIIAKHLLEKNKFKQNSFVATTMSNKGLHDFAEKNSLGLILTDVGDKYVIQEMREKELILGGEQSGHIILSNYSTTGDGIITALNILKIMKKENKKLSELKQVMEKYPQVLMNLKVKEKKPIEKLNAFQEKLNEFEKALGKQGRILVRYSGTEPLIRVMIEGKNKAQIQLMAETLVNELRKAMN